jgi:hypothetical protein
MTREQLQLECAELGLISPQYSASASIEELNKELEKHDSKPLWTNASTLAHACGAIKYRDGKKLKQLETMALDLQVQHIETRDQQRGEHRRWQGGQPHSSSPWSSVYSRECE